MAKSKRGRVARAEKRALKGEAFKTPEQSKQIRMVEPPKVSVGGTELTGEAKAQALGSMFGPAAADHARRHEAKTPVRFPAPGGFFDPNAPDLASASPRMDGPAPPMQVPVHPDSPPGVLRFDLDAEAARASAAKVEEVVGGRVTREEALRHVKAAQTEADRVHDGTVLAEVLRAEGVDEHAVMDDRENDALVRRVVTPEVLQRHAAAFQTMSAGGLVVLRERLGLEIPDAWLAASAARDKAEAEKALEQTTGEYVDMAKRAKVLDLDAAIMRVVADQGPSKNDPRLALLSPEARADALELGLEISPTVVAAIDEQGEDLRMMLAAMFTGQNNAMRPVPGSAVALSTNPVRVFATGDLRLAQYKALEMGAPADQMIDPRLDTLLDSEGAHVFVATDILDDEARLEREPLVDGAPPRAMSAAFMRGTIWLKTAFAMPNQPVQTEVTLPIQAVMQALPVQDFRAPHRSYQRTVEKAKALGDRPDAPLFQVTLDEMVSMVRGEDDLEGIEGLTAIPESVLRDLPEQTRASLLASHPDLQVIPG